MAWALGVGAVPNVLPGQGVYVAAGNVHYQPAGGGAARLLTTSGRDTAPVLSPDGRTVGFVRRTPGRSIKTGSGLVEATELWEVGTDGTDARRLIAARASARMDAVLAGFDRPQFSPDGERIYFESAAWATSNAVHVVNRRTGAVHFVCAGDLIEVVLRGKYAGDLIVAQHRYFLIAGSYDWVWLVTPTGRDVGPLGDADASDVTKILAEFHDLYAKR